MILWVDSSGVYIGFYVSAVIGFFMASLGLWDVVLIRVLVRVCKLVRVRATLRAPDGRLSLLILAQRRLNLRQRQHAAAGHFI